MKIGIKLIVGFCIVASLVALVGFLSMVSIKKVGNSTDIILDEKVPIADHSMEAMISLISGRDLMGEFLLNHSSTILDEAEKEFNQSMNDFDTHTEYIEKNGTDEIKTVLDNAQEYHKKFEENAVELMKQHRLSIAAKLNADKTMENFDEHEKDLRELLENYERELTRNEKIDEKVDAAMEAKTVMVEQKAIAEEYMGIEDLNKTAELRKAFKNHMEEFDALEALLPKEIKAEHEDFCELAIGKGNMFDQKDEALSLIIVTREKMALVDEYSKKGDELMDKVEEIAGKDMEAAMQDADSAQATGNWLVIAFTIISFFLAICIGFFIGRGISVPLGRAVEVADAIAGGDLEQKVDIDRSDEIGHLGKSMAVMIKNLKDQKSEIEKNVSDLNEVLNQVATAAEQISSGSSQVSDSSQSVSQGATEQASSLEEITSSMNELGSQTKQNAENASQANQLSAAAREAAENGNNQMQGMVTAMREINESGKNISKIIKVIDEIAFQTNLLALNAAVEAARAGKHGKGFAVVAEEVRNLAGRSAKAAKETAELIEGSVKKTEKGTDIATKTAEALNEILTGITKASDLVGEIAAASNDQAQGITQVNQGLGQIDQVTQQATANAEEAASAAEELSGQAAQLKGILDQFRKRDQNQQSLAHAGAEPISERPRSLPARNNRRITSPNDGNKQGIGVVNVDPKRVIPLDDTEFGKY